MIALKPTVLTITLNVNGLKSQNKSQRVRLDQTHTHHMRSNSNAY
jgi:hypothetical protein